MKTVRGQSDTVYDVSTIFHVDRHLRVLSNQLKSVINLERFSDKTLKEVAWLNREIDILLDSRLAVMPGKHRFIHEGEHPYGVIS